MLRFFSSLLGEGLRVFQIIARVSLCGTIRPIGQEGVPWALTPLYVKTRVQAAWMSSWRARKSVMTRW